MPERPAPPPVAPVIPAELVQEEAPQSMVEMEEEEDEETIAAAPDASAFAPRASGHKPAHVAIYAKLFFRRTIIPILLTCGIMLPAIGVWSMLDHNAPLAAVGTHVEILMIVVGAILLGLGIVNALHVKHIMDTAAKHQNS
jgi:NADH:ubiquinone oxidoreductase subunit K